MVEKKPEVLVIIPARGGSKGIPRKNIRDFAGYPLIAYSIQAALNSKYVTRIIVSTDDEEIAAVAKQYGAEVPFLRPGEIAQDKTLDLPVFEHVLKQLEVSESYFPDIVVQLRPTSPIRPLSLVDEAIQLLIDNPDVDSVRGVIPSGQNPHKMWKIDDKTGLMQGLLRVDNIEEPYNSPRQILPETFWQTGHIDAIRPSVIQEKHSMSGKRILPVMVDPDYTVDIDKPSDWQRAEWLVWYGGLKMVTPGNARRDLPKKIDLIVFDFDGVMTNNLVYVNQDGVESIAANRSDGMGIVLLRKSGIKAMVLSTETNPVVQVRCKKLKLPVIQGVENKDIVLRDYLKTNDIDPNNVIFVGNDVNDVSCFSIVGCALAVADAHPIALRQADVILKHNGGDGAVREVCDLVMKTQSR